MTKKELFENFDMTAREKTETAIECIRKAKTIKDAKWYTYETVGELQGLYRGYTEAGELTGICKCLDEEFFKGMWVYRNKIYEELAIFMVKKKKK